MSREFEYFVYTIEGLAAGGNMPTSFLFISPCNCVCVAKYACSYAGLAGYLHFVNTRSPQILSLSFYSRRNDLSYCRSHAPWGLSSRRWRYRNGWPYVQLSLSAVSTYMKLISFPFLLPNSGLFGRVPECPGRKNYSSVKQHRLDTWSSCSLLILSPRLIEVEQMNKSWERCILRVLVLEEPLSRFISYAIELWCILILMLRRRRLSVYTFFFNTLP